MVLLDRRSAPRDLVVELPGGEDLLGRQHVLADDAAALAHADRRARRHEHRTLVSRNALAQEAKVLARLASPLTLGRGKLVGIRRVDFSDARHQRHHHAFVRRAMHGAFDARQRVSSRVARLAHQRPQLLLRHRLGARDVDVRDAKHRRQALHVVAGRLEGSAGKRADVRVARRVDDHPRADPPHPSLRGGLDLDDPAVLDGGGEDERVQERRRTRVVDELVPDALQRLRVVRDAGAGAVGVRPLERHPALDQPSDDLVGDARDDLPRRGAGRIERVEGVEHRRRGAPEKPEAVDEQRGRTRACGRDRRRAPRRAGADHEDVDTSAHLCKSTHE